MKLYLASFLEQDNFGPGRVIGIVNGDKPGHIQCDFKFAHLTPSQELMDQYNDMTLNDPLNASKAFVDGFNKQLDEFCEDVMATAKDKGKVPSELLPFKDGDTLASWERENYRNYRTMVAPILQKLGYEVILK